MLNIFSFFKYYISEDQKLAAINSYNQEDHPRNIQVQNTNSPTIQEDYYTQVSQEIEGRVTKYLCRSSVGQSTAFWHLFKARRISSEPTSPGSLRTRSSHPRHPGIQTKKTRERKRTVPRMILKLKWVSPWANSYSN